MQLNGDTCTVCSAILTFTLSDCREGEEEQLFSSLCQYTSVSAQAFFFSFLFSESFVLHYSKMQYQHFQIHSLWSSVVQNPVQWERRAKTEGTRLILIFSRLSADTL